MATSGWKQWKEEDAVRELHAQRESGEAAGTFARKRGYSSERLRRWRERLEQKAAPRFLAVRVIAGPLPEAPPVPLEVVLHGGRVLRVGRGFDAGQLGELVRVLEALPC